MADRAYFLTVDWCDQGKRGVFCRSDGIAFRKDDEPHTLEEMMNILNVFSIVLAPQSKLLTADELAEHTVFHPLSEFSYQYGYAVKPTKEEEL